MNTVLLAVALAAVCDVQERPTGNWKDAANPLRSHRHIAAPLMMSMPMMCVRIMGMGMRERPMAVPVNVRFRNRPVMLMLMVLVMDMLMLMLKYLMRMFVLMVLGKVQPYPGTHEQRGCGQLKR